MRRPQSAAASALKIAGEPKELIVSRGASRYKASDFV
jgi:hypothetical protein